MTVSLFVKSHGPSNGPGPLVEGPPHQVQNAGQAADERWQDDGAPLAGSPAVSVEAKPVWSVLSRSALNEAIRRERQADDPARMRQELERTARRRTRALQVEEDKATHAARAGRDRYRNAWENT